MAAFSQPPSRLSSLFPPPSLEFPRDLPDHQPRPDLDSNITTFGRSDPPSRIFGDRLSSSSNGFPANSHIDYLNSDKNMLLDSPRPDHLSGGGEIFVDSSPATIDGLLDITIHHARDIHNICIYGNQDVYAKFSVTHSQDAVYSTQPVRAGGKNPVFNQSVQILVSQPDAVLKCEIWMMSCARTYLEDQLLGFVLVPLAGLVGSGKHTQDYALSSTDLFHTPAGTVCLSLAFHTRGALQEAPLHVSQRSPEVVLMECGNQSSAPMDYNKIEFPDLQVASENQQMVSVYLKMASGDLRLDSGSTGQTCPGRKLGYDDMRMAPQHQEFSGAPFLQLCTTPMVEVDCEMALNSGEDKCVEGTPFSSDDHTSPSHDTNLSCVEAPPSSPSVNTVPSSTTTEEQNSGGGQEPNSSSSSDMPTSSSNHFLGSSDQTIPSPGSVSSAAGRSSSGSHENGTAHEQESKGSSFTAPLVSISMDPEEPVVQQQIVDMYMKSMQQFTDSLAKMKLPLDLDGGQARVELKNTRVEKKGTTEPAKKDGHRVFYGSRAFF